MRSLSTRAIVERVADHYLASGDFNGYPIRQLARDFNLPEGLVRRICGLLEGSALGLTEEAVEFAAGRVEGVLLLLRAVMKQRAAILVNHLVQ